MKEQLLSSSQIQSVSGSVMNDPFAQARAKFDKSNSTVLSSSEAPAPSLQSVVGSSSPQQVSAFNGSDLPSMMNKHGINDQGLAMNEIGKMQLLGRLQGKFGQDYMSNPDVLDIISAFDSHLKGLDSSQSSMNEMKSSADRTLKAILGGS